MFNGNKHGCRYLDFNCGGNRFLSMENSIFRMTFWLNKGADLIELRHKATDIDVLWRSPLPMPDAGSFISPNSTPSFIDYYPGGWQEAFPNAHSPVSEYKNAPLGQNGEVCLLPWSYEVLECHETMLKIKMFVSTTRTPFKLTRIISLMKDDAFFRMDKTIENLGLEEMHYNWGHHSVFGAPLLEENCIIDLAEGSVAVVPDFSFSHLDRYVRNQRNSWPNLTDKNGNQVDASQILAPHAKSMDAFEVELTSPWVALRNPKLNLGIGMAWELTTFPYLWIWEAYCGSPGYPFYSRNYNLGLEPYSVPIETLTESIERGHSHQISPGETVHSSFMFGFTQGIQPIKHIGLDGTFRFEN
jgi:hypothetical protein